MTKFKSTVFLFATGLAFAAVSLLHTGCSATPCEDCCKPDAAWDVIFSGESTALLRGYNDLLFPSDKNWRVDDGTLHALPGGHGDLITKKQYKNFELEYEWKVSPGGNSGVMYHVAETKGPSYMTGPEMQVLDDAGHGDGKNPKTSAGALYALIAPSAAKKTNPVGEWNKARVVFKNNHVEHWLNGAKIVDYTWGSDELKALIKVSKFKDWPEFMTKEEGYIAFQHHGQEAWFRNIRVRGM